MKVIKGNLQLFAKGRQLQQSGRIEDAAAVYQQVVNADPGNREAVGRLLGVYRRLKEFRKELAVINAALGAVVQRDKILQDKWIAAHPEAAKLGKEVLRKMGGQSVSVYGTDPMVGRLLKRKVLVEKKLGGVKQAGRGKKKNSIRNSRKAAKALPAKGKQAEKDQQASLTAARKIAAEKRKRLQQERKEAIAAVRKAAAEKKKEEAAGKRRLEAEARKAAKEVEAEARRREKQAKARSSLFVVSLRYLARLDKIDAAMEKHVAFLDKHFAAGTFLVSGRQVPRAGGIIMARGKDRMEVERIMRQDPFVKGRLASVDIVEFQASKMRKGLEGWL